MTKVLMVSLALTLGVACADPVAEEDAGTEEHEDGTCASQSDCAQGYVCLAYGDEGSAVCSLSCSASADECGSSASCAGVGAVEASVCQDDAHVASEGEPPEEEDRPRLICESDAECAPYGAGVVCAQYNGLKECSLVCDQDAECNPPPMAGVTTSFLRCGADEGDASRDVCLPNEVCWTDPASCIDYGF